MSNKEIEEHLKFAEGLRQRLQNDPSQALAFLVRAGIMKEDGTVSENYPAWRAHDLAMKNKE